MFCGTSDCIASIYQLVLFSEPVIFCSCTGLVALEAEMRTPDLLNTHIASLLFDSSVVQQTELAAPSLSLAQRVECVCVCRGGTPLTGPQIWLTAVV